MNREVKINSITAPPYTTSQNIVRFRFGGGKVYNLRDSIMHINATFDIDKGAGIPNGVFIPDLQVITTGDKKPLPQNVSFVRNATISCARKGIIESLSRVDQLKTNLHNYTKSQRELFGEGYLRCSAAVAPINGQQYSIFAQINKEGSIPSRVRKDVPIQVRLGDIWDICNTPEFDTAKAGDLTLECELNVDRFEAVQRYTAQGFSGVCNDVPDPGADGFAVNTLVMTNKPKDLQSSDVYVGMPVQATATGNGGAGNLDVVAVISSITIAADGTRTLVFDRNLTTLDNGQSLTAVEIASVAWAGATVSYDSAEVVLQEVANPVGMDAIAYTTFSTEEDNGNSLTNFQRQYQVEPEASNVMIIFPDEQNELNSTNNHLVNYRLRLNNDNLTSERVVVSPRSPLYYDRISMLIDGMGMPLRNLQENSGSNADGTGQIAWGDVYTQAENRLTVIGNPLYPTERTKLLQVNISATSTGVRQITLFKTLPRVFEY